ncbi:MAG: hypothetical protein WC523_03990 [Patescibacteria group bacterium]
MTKQDYIDAFTLWLSGAAKMKNDKEIWWKNDYNADITVEFPNKDTGYVIVRSYGSNGNIEWMQKFVPSGSYLTGIFFRYDMAGQLISKKHYRNGRRTS